MGILLVLRCIFIESCDMCDHIFMYAQVHLLSHLVIFLKICWLDSPLSIELDLNELAALPKTMQSLRMSPRKHALCNSGNELADCLVELRRICPRAWSSLCFSQHLPPSFPLVNWEYWLEFQSWGLLTYKIVQSYLSPTLFPYSTINPGIR